MASASLINKVKYSPLLYAVYYYAGSLAIKLLKLMLRPDERLILFSSYSGKRYDDSPKDIYEAMLHDHRFDGYKLVWAFSEPERYNIGRAHKVKVDTLSYYKAALKARVWITNVSMTRGLSFKGINTFSLNTWHGVPIKFIGSDVRNSDGGTFRIKGKVKTIDIQLAQGSYEKSIYPRAFGLDEKQVLVTGLPRNDSLVYDNYPEKIAILRKELGIPEGKKVILYAPTYREYEKDKWRNCIMKPPFNLKRWKAQLSEDYVLMIRAHQEVVKVLNLEEDEFVRDASSFPVLNDLLLITDILISDYSSIIFDFSILSRPIICYTYDFERYKQARGMYFDIRKELPSADTEERLISIIKSNNQNKMREVVIRFRDKYIQEYGNSSQRVLDVVFNALNKH